MQKIQNGSFLIAHPTMLDETFFKSIILITHHNSEETIGLIINNPSKIKLYEIIDDLPKSDFPVYIGGPVAKNSIHYIHDLEDSFLCQKLGVRVVAVELEVVNLGSGVGALLLERRQVGRAKSGLLHRVSDALLR